MDENEIRRMVEEEGLSFSKVAKMLQKNVGVISIFCKKNNIKSKHMDSILQKELPVDDIYKKYEAGSSFYELQKAYGAPAARIRRGLKKKYPNIKFRSVDDANRPKELNDKDKLLELSKKFSFRQIAKMLNVKPYTVCLAARKFEIKSTACNLTSDIPYDELDELYNNQKLTPGSIAKIYNQKYGSILRKLRRCNFEIQRPGGISKPSKYASLNDRSWLYNEYEVKSRSMDNIANEVGCNISMVKYYLTKHGIKTRSKSEYVKLLLSRHYGLRQEYNGIWCDSANEVNFLRSLGSFKDIQRNIEFSDQGSVAFIDFLIDGNHYEVKSKERSSIPGVNRRRMIKQWLICKNNGIDLKMWNDKDKFFNVKIEDLDVYYCHNWRLVFKNPDDCSEWLIKFGFHGVEHPNMELVDGIKEAMIVKPGDELNANYANVNGLKCIKHFSQHYFRSSHKGYLPISAAWEIGNQSVLRRAVADLWTKEINIYLLVKHIGKFFKDFTPVSIFKPWIAKHVYEKYLPNGGKIIDPCMGWGGRFIASFDRHQYMGYDLNINSVDAHQKMHQFYKNRVKNAPQFLVADSSTCDFPDGDLLFTSPPYDDAEYYHGIDSSRTKTAPIIDNIFKKFNGLTALNVPKRQRDMCVAVAQQHNWQVIEELQMKTSSFMGREKTFEPILVFRKLA
ncbi:MAG: hypothetical protein Q8K86_08810 [Candidatus Nanopelagicaceae bacterium]|nr:hypothetical protein [Candidatus Nanopelagicaceae bacterium]